MTKAELVTTLRERDAARDAQMRESTLRAVRELVGPLLEAVQALRVEVAGLHESRDEAIAEAAAEARRDVKAIYNEVVRRLVRPSKT